MFLQRFVDFTAHIPLRLSYFLRIQGKKNLPEGNYILVANHGSLMDPVLMHITLPSKYISFLSSPKLFECPRFCQAFLRKMGAIPVTDGVRELVELKKQAEERRPHRLICVFSQGTISKEPTDFKPGAAILALQTGLPMVPVYLHCAPFFRGGSRICFGKPLPVEKQPGLDKKTVMALTREIQERVYALSQDKKKR